MPVNRRFLKTINDIIFIEDPPQPADIVFVPGNKYPHMAERAAQLFKAGYARWILPSGKYAAGMNGFDVGNYNTEWEFLHDVLLQNGVDECWILKEDKAVNTYENAVFSKAVTDRAGLTPQKAIICCNTFHARRSLMYYQLLFPDTEFWICPVAASGITVDNWHQSKTGRSLVLGEMERLGWQFHKIVDEN